MSMEREEVKGIMSLRGRPQSQPTPESGRVHRHGSVESKWPTPVKKNAEPRWKCRRNREKSLIRWGNVAGRRGRIVCRGMPNSSKRCVHSSLGK